jgi:hypothetical protein
LSSIYWLKHDLIYLNQWVKFAIVLVINFIIEGKKALVTTKTASKAQIVLAQLVVTLMIVFVALGVALYGVSAEVRERVWQNLLDRPGGPMTFRFILQPIMATIAALYDGVTDARTGRSPYLWTIFFNAEQRGGRLREGLISTARVILLGLCMDLIYQFMEFKTFHPAEAVIIALLLAFAPYLLLRGPCARIAHWWRGDAQAN